MLVEYKPKYNMNQDHHHHLSSSVNSLKMMFLELDYRKYNINIHWIMM